VIVPGNLSDGVVVGCSVTRLEDRPLVTGQARYVGDLSFPRQVHLSLARSMCAHGLIRHVHIAAARAVPGVLAIWTNEDVSDLPPIDFRDQAAEALRPYRQPILACGRVRYVGEPIAAVFATDPRVAEDAAELVQVEVAELPSVLDATAQPGEFEPGRDTEALVLRASYGDLDAAFASAYAVVELGLSIGRHSGVPIETRGAIGRYDAALDVLELYGAAKVPHRNREALARWLGRGPSGLHLHEVHVGGVFGIPGELYPEDFLVLVGAMRLRRPVKWIEDRREHLMAANHSRQQHHRVRAAIDAEGRVLALDDTFFLDQGAYGARTGRGCRT
jgi:aerobic carbon-monoxide dehydrogenase large subunit